MREYVCVRMVEKVGAALEKKQPAHFTLFVACYKNNRYAYRVCSICSVIRAAIEYRVSYGGQL